MNLLKWLFGKKTVDAETKTSDYFPQTHIPTRTYNKSVSNVADSDNDDYERRRRKRQQDDDDLLSPLNPISPLWIGNQNSDFDSGNSSQPDQQSNDFGGGSFGGAGSSGDWSNDNSSSSSSDSSSSSSDSGSYDSGSSSDSSSSSSD